MDTKPKNNLHVEFFIDNVEDAGETKKQGRPIYKEVEMVRIRYVADRNTVLVAPALEKSFWDAEVKQHFSYAERFPDHYKAFKASVHYIGEGTPLLQAGIIAGAKAKELAHFNIHTVEALAELDGQALQGIGMGGRDLKNRAVAFLAKQNGNAEVMKIANENSELKARLDELKAQLDLQAATMAATQTAKPKSEGKAA
jgi:hypothetical protein